MSAKLAMGLACYFEECKPMAAHYTVVEPVFIIGGLDAWTTTGESPVRYGLPSRCRLAFLDTSQLWGGTALRLGQATM